MLLVRNVSSLLLILSAAYAYCQSNDWEYTLSDPGLPGSEIHDLILIEDKLVLAGALSNCHAPTLWITDTSKINLEEIVLPLLQDKDEEFPLGYYGKINALYHDSITNKIFALGLAGLADDVGPHYPAIYRLEGDLTLDTFLLLKHPDSGSEWTIHDSVFIRTGGQTIHFINHDLEVIHEIKLPLEKFFGYQVHLYEHEFLVHQNSHYPSSNHISRYSFQGEIIEQVEIDTIVKSVLVDDLLALLTKRKSVRFVDAKTLTPIEGHGLPSEGPYDIRKNNYGQLEVLSYEENDPPEIGIYDSDLNLIFSYASDLPGEKNLINYYHQSSLYQVGQFYEIDYNSRVRPGLIHFLRKTRPQLPTRVRRASIEILDVSIENTVLPDECFTYDDGTESCYFSGRQASYYNLTIRNNGSETIRDFSYHTSVLFGFNCARGFAHRLKQEVDLAPNDTMLLRDSFHLYGGANDSLYFYVIAPNHMLHDIHQPFLSPDASTANRLFQPTALTIYPNPATEVIFLSIEEPIFQVQIYDLQGHLVKKTHRTRTIDIGELPRGLYLLTVESKDQVASGKFLKI